MEISDFYRIRRRVRLFVLLAVLPFSIAASCFVFLQSSRFTPINKYGYIDKTGKWVIAPSPASNLINVVGGFSEGLVPIREQIGSTESFNYKWGYIDRSGHTVISPKYTFAWSFHDGLAAVLLNNKIGYIDHSGQFIISPQFDKSYNELHDFNEGRAAVEVNEKWGLIDKSGKFIVEPKYGFIGPFSEHLASFTIHRKLKGYLDLNGNVVIKPQFDDVEPFSEGLAAIHFYTGQPGKWECGFADKTGKIVFHDPNWATIGSFHEGLASIRYYTDISKEKCVSGFVDKTGKLVIGPISGYLSSFHDGLAVISTKSGSHGYIDKTGKKVMPEKCDDNLPARLLRMQASIMPASRWGPAIDRSKNVFDFHEGLAISPLNTLIKAPKWGFIDKSGEWVIAPQFALPEYYEEGTGYFEEGLARVGTRN